MVVSIYRQLPFQQEDNVTKCTICLDPIALSAIMKLLCDHIFHRHCIEKWKERKNTCPLCRKVIDITKAVMLKERSNDREDRLLFNKLLHLITTAVTISSCIGVVVLWKDKRKNPLPFVSCLWVSLISGKMSCYFLKQWLRN